MMKQFLATTPVGEPLFPPGDLDECEVAELLREILAYLQQDGAVGGPLPMGDPAGEAICEVELDGQHYTLLRRAPDSPSTTVKLSPREQEIVRLVSQGLPNKAIATVLDVSPWTIATHLRRIFAKLEVNSRAEMITRAVEKGVLRTG